MRWIAAESRAATTAEELAAAAATVAGTTEQAARASTAQGEAANLLPPLRQTEAERGAAHHRLIVEREQLDAEEARAREAAQRIRQLIAQATADIDREQTLETDAGNALAVLGEEGATLAAAAERADADIATAGAEAAAFHEALTEVESLLERLTAELAEWNARKASLERGRDLASALFDTSTNQLSDAQARLDRADGKPPGTRRTFTPPKP